MTYYEIICFENAQDEWDILPWKGVMKASKLLHYSVETDLKVGQLVENESLAMKILIENLNARNFRGSTEEKLREMIEGQFGKVLVRKYESSISR